MNTLKKLINVKSGATYYIKNSSNTSANVTYILYFTETNTLIKCEYDKNIVTIPDNCAKIRFSGSNLNKLCFSLNNFYSEYKEDKRTVLLDSPLRKVGTIADVLDLGKSQVIRKSHKIVLDNNIGGYETNSKNGKKGYNITLSKKAKDGKLICDKLPVVNEYIVWEETIGIYIKNNEIIIYHNGESLTDFKTWLASNPITVVYELATPTTENIQVSPTDNPLTSYTPSTTLTTNNNIKGNISADMPTNLSGVITQQASLIAQLEDNLLQTQALLIDNAIDNA